MQTYFEILAAIIATCVTIVAVGLVIGIGFEVYGNIKKRIINARYQLDTN